MTEKHTQCAWTWIPSLYFVEGVPYILVTAVSIFLLKNLGMDNEWALFWSNFLSFPWILKPLWAPMLDMFGTRRGWIVAMQLLMAAASCVIALLCRCSAISWILFLVFVIAFASATHDAAVDAYYIMALSEHDQAFYSGLRSAAYKLAVLAGQGGLVMLAGYIHTHFTLSFPVTWMLCMFLVAASLILLAMYHLLFIPRCCHSGANEEHAAPGEFATCLASFFQKPHIIAALLFLLFFRFAEAQLKVAIPFMIDPANTGALAISQQNQGLLYGTFGMIALTLGGILGGVIVAKQGIGRWIWPMALAMNLPDLVYVYLSFTLPQNLWIIGISVFIEQFGYGFGYTGFTLFMVYYVSGSGKFTTSHFALMTGLVALGMMIPGMLSGHLLKVLPQWLAWIQGISALSAYQIFFLWVTLCTLPSYGVTALIKRFVDPEFGRR